MSEQSLVRQKLKSNSIDFRMAYATAAEFHTQVAQMLDQVPKELEAANQYFGSNPTKLPFIATNLIFACELYFKTIIMFDGKSAPQHHNIWKLFNQIQPSNRTLIEKEFLSEIQLQPNSFSMHLLLSARGKIPSDEVYAKLRSDKQASPKGDFISLKRVLKDTKDSYLTWRYLYQSIDSKKGEKILRFHWVHLLCLCTVLSKMIKNSIELSGEKRCE